MSIKVLGKRILIERKEALEKTAGGILIPDNQQEKQAEGKIISVGKDVKDLAVNDIILFNKWAGKELIINGKEYCLLNEEDVGGIII